MNSNVTEYIISADGSICREQRTRCDIDVNETVIGVLTAKRQFRLGNVFHIGIQPMSIIQEGKACYWTLPLVNIPMQAPYRVTRGIAVPDFKSKTEPVLPMIWSPPADCVLKMMFMTYADGKMVFMEKAWLFAIDEKKFYRLPLANIYEDCSLCLGEFNQWRLTHQECIEAALQQFQLSKWNSDLWDAPDMTQRCFQWKVLDKGFEVLPPDGKWQDLSKKISTPVTAYLQ